MRTIFPPRYPNRNQNCNNLLGDLIAIVGVGISIYIATINRRNLDYNARNAYASEQINEQLKRLNNSYFMEKLNCELDKEDKK